MGDDFNPRDLKPSERKLLEFMLTAEFPGKNELLRQMDTVKVIGECDCGCGTVDLGVGPLTPLAKTREPIAVEAHRSGLDVLLFVRGGRLALLEIVNYEEVPPLRYPSPEELELWVPPQPKSGQQ